MKPHRNNFDDISEPNVTGVAVRAASTHDLDGGRRPGVCASSHAHDANVQHISHSAMLQTHTAACLLRRVHGIGLVPSVVWLAGTDA